MNDQRARSDDDADATAIPGGLTRRTLIGAAAAGAAAAALPAGAAAAPRRRSAPRRGGRADVIVVGAGLAGLTAARDLARRGRSVIVLEGRDRVGGRTRNESIGGGDVLEVGGQWVGPGQDRVLALARSVGVKTFKSYFTGTQTFEYQGKRTEFTGLIPPLPEPDATEFVQKLVELETLAKQVPANAPWTAARAREWDAMTVETWKQQNLRHDGGKFLIDLTVQSIYACEPRDVSFLHFLFYGNAGGGFTYLASTPGGAQDSRFVGGSQLISQRVARALGRRVRLGAPVHAIHRRGSRVLVESDAGTFTGRRVVVALPPTLAGRLDYDPILPALRDQLTQRTPAGSIIKVEATYPTPFWRKAGRSGYTNSDVRPIGVTWDNSPPSGKQGALISFICGSDARRYAGAPVAARRRLALDGFARLFGPQAAKPTRYIEGNWSAERFTRGCYGAILPPGVWTEYGPALRPAVGPIHWAGAEYATKNPGYMDGAVRSGEAAARAVLAAR